MPFMFLFKMFLPMFVGGFLGGVLMFAGIQLQTSPPGQNPANQQIIVYGDQS